MARHAPHRARAQRSGSRHSEVPIPKRTGRPWQRLKAQVIARDHGICHLCGKPGADSADHLVPAALGGTETMANLKAVHHDVWPKCNRIRGDRPLDEVRREMGGHDVRGGWSW